ncbi:MAG: IS1182 family transposase [Desulfobacterales bacterium]|nr:IS1182 family transposase [Desulfobacterales bacterium]
MAKYKPYNYSQTVMLPISLDDQLAPGTIEFAIHTLVEERMDVSRFDARYSNDETGCKAYDPKILLKIILLAYSRGIIHSRKIERECKRNVTFMALSCGQEPDHSTIAAFVSGMKGEIKPLFSDVLLICEEMKLLGGTEFSLDGCKLASNASKRWSGTFSTLKEKKEKIERRVTYLLEEQVEADKREERDEKEKAGRAHFIAKLKKQAAKIEKFLEKNEPKPGKQRKEVQSNVTDNESATMTTSHGTIQGYNGQALVDAKHQVIVSGEAFGSGQDQYHLEPVLTEAQENMKGIGKDDEYFKDTILTADMAYHSGENIKRCEEESIDAYMPDKNYRKRHPGLGVKKSSIKSRRRKFMPEDFIYDEKTDEYECPAGKKLKRHTRSYNTRWGTMYVAYRAEKGDCEVCTHREGCISKKGKKGKRKYLSIPIKSNRRNYSQEMAAKMDTERGREIYPHRIKIVEPVFANIRTQKRLDRFTLRGKVKVNIQWLLYCMVHNIEKIANFGTALAEG